MSVKQLHNNSDLQEVTRSSHLSVVDFFTLWCSPCKTIAPKIEQLAKTYTNVSFYKVDVDEMNDAAEKSNVSAMPTFPFYKGGTMVAQIVGADYNKIKRTVEAFA